MSVDKKHVNVTSLSPKERVERYLSKHSASPLKFGRVENMWGSTSFTNKLEILEKKASLIDWVLWVLEESAHRNTYYSSNGKVQCYSGAYRSAMDIWRVILHYNREREVSLQDVMKAMYSSRKHLGAQYCSVVKKRVFWDSDNPYNSWDGDELDEFRLKFHQWLEV